MPSLSPRELLSPDVKALGWESHSTSPSFLVGWGVGCGQRRGTGHDRCQRPDLVELHRGSHERKLHNCEGDVFPPREDIARRMMLRMLMTRSAAL